MYGEGIMFWIEVVGDLASKNGLAAVEAVSSLVLKESLTAVGASLTPVMVTVSVASFLEGSIGIVVNEVEG